MKIVFFQRKPQAGANFSLEGFFEGLRAALPSRNEIEVSICSRFSRGIFTRLYLIIEAWWRARGDVFHVSGDVHFLTYLLPRRKTVLTVLDVGFMDRTSGLRRALLRLFWLTLPCLCAARITVISEATKKELLKWVRIPKDKISVIPVFISDAFQVSETPKQFNTKSPVLLQVGTKPNKNLERVIDAIEGKIWVLEIVGILTDQQRVLLNAKGIKFRNSVSLSESELVARYQQCDVVVFASTYEGFGMPILEAQATGKPVITSKILSMPEVGGEGACYVDPFRVDSIGAGIERIMADREYREDLVRKGHANVERFSRESIAAEYLKLYAIIGRTTNV
jgi:glycosyltransferase involved in cell wall biosynthesis